MSQIDIPDFDRLISGNGTPGNMGDTGAIYTAKINGNFALIKVTEQQIDAILTEMAARMLTFITAGAIKSLNVTTSGILQYSTDGVSYTDCIQWGKIRGSITNQSDLRTLLDEKASIVTVTALESLITGLRADVNTNTSNIASNLTKINTNTADIATINTNISTINNQLALRPLGNGIRQFRISGGRLEYSLSDPSSPNPTWVPVSAEVTVTWQSITGNPTDNQALNQILIQKADQTDVDALTTALGLLTPRVTTLEQLIGNTNVQQIAQDLATHVADTNNPHQVTKADVGLGNVENTADADKPLSLAQQQYVDNEIAGVQSDIQDVDSDLGAHINDTSNPHSVTKSQVGLGNVNNTSDADKPLSNIQRTELNRRVASFPNTAMYVVSQAQYDAITKQTGVVYIIDNTKGPEALSYDNAYVYANNEMYRETFDIEIPAAAVANMSVLGYLGERPSGVMLFDDSVTVPTSGSDIEVKFRVTSADTIWTTSELVLGTITIV